MNRRQALGILGLATTVGLVGCTADEVERAAKAAEAAKDYVPTFFTPEEWRTVSVLADIVIPKDERSGSATDAGVPAFIDFMMGERTESGAQLRAGLAWLDAESRKRFTAGFAALTAEQQLAIVNDIAWPKQAPAGMDEGVEFFKRFRNLCASGFWSSRTGVEDLGYRGNVANASWEGCPEPQLRKLGVSYG
jgi:hypothetical protein